MARVDDYFNAKVISVEKLALIPIVDICRKSGFAKENNDKLLLPFLNRSYSATWPDFNFTDLADPKNQVPIQEQVLILHYLLGENPLPPSGKIVAYREIPGASFYLSAFIKRAVDPLKKAFGENLTDFKKAAEKLSGKPIEAGDLGFEFLLFPKIPIQLVLWEGDEEFTPEANILFDETIKGMLSPEDIAWLSGMLVYRLMAITG